MARCDYVMLQVGPVGLVPLARLVIVAILAMNTSVVAVQIVEDSDLMSKLAALRARCAAQIGFTRALTNGYKQGFYGWSLLGEAYRRARPADFGPYAYRAWANAAAYMPPYTALVWRTFAERLPAAQLYQKLGHACNNIGRLQDAEAYFNTALALGSNDWALWQDCAGMLAMLALDDGRQKQAEALLVDLFASTNTPAGHAYAAYARVLQYRGKLREMYQILLEYLQTQDMDLKEAGQNPALFLAIDNLARATDAEIAGVYVGIGKQLTLAPLQSGCEQGVARLINQRTLMARVYPWLGVESDLSNVLHRVASQDSATKE